VTDAIRLTVPRARRYHGVVRLVIGGLAARLDLSYEYLEDVQLAVETLIANEAYAAGSDITVEVHLAADAVEVVVGPLDAGSLEPALAADAEAATGLGLHRLLTTVVENFEVERRDGAEWVRMRKTLRNESMGSPA
jgi:anti-sigma regulatory factor (Ser/Thr protein kinase)